MARFTSLLLAPLRLLGAGLALLPGTEVTSERLGRPVSLAET